MQDAELFIGKSGVFVCVCVCLGHSAQEEQNLLDKQSVS